VPTLRQLFSEPAVTQVTAGQHPTKPVQPLAPASAAKPSK
jgi:hypothetical protein